MTSRSSDRRFSVVGEEGHTPTRVYRLFSGPVPQSRTVPEPDQQFTFVCRFEARPGSGTARLSGTDSQKRQQTQVCLWGFLANNTSAAIPANHMAARPCVCLAVFRCTLHEYFFVAKSRPLEVYLDLSFALIQGNTRRIRLLAICAHACTSGSPTYFIVIYQPSPPPPSPPSPLLPHSPQNTTS